MKLHTLFLLTLLIEAGVASHVSVQTSSAMMGTPVVETYQAPGPPPPQCTPLDPCQTPKG